MNDSVDMARDVCKPQKGYGQDLSQMLKELIANGIPKRVRRGGRELQTKKLFVCSSSNYKLFD